MKSLLLFLCLALHAGAKETTTVTITKKEISYYPESISADAGDYLNERCKLDIRYPSAEKGFPTLIWFHGGGLTGGEKYFLQLDDPSIAVVTVNYRLSPKAKLPAFIEDAAAATAWTLKNIADYGGDPEKVFISGHSAGGYLSLMVGMEKKWLAPYKLSNMDLAGIIPVSAQVTTHFQVKKMLGDKKSGIAPTIDEYAPLYHVENALPPVCIITGDRKIEWPSRVEENEFLAITLKNLKHPGVEFHEMPDVDHGGAGGKSAPIVVDFIHRISSLPVSPAVKSE